MISYDNFSIKSINKKRLQRILELMIIIFLSIVLGLIITSVSIKAWIMAFAIVPLLIFFAKPVGFLLAYLAFSPIIDQLIPFFTTDISGFRFGPQILFRGGLTALLASYWLFTRRNIFSFSFTKPMFFFISLNTITTIAYMNKFALGISELSKVAFWMLLLATVADLVMEEKMNIRSIYWFTLISIGFTIVSVLISEYFGLQIKMTYRNFGVLNVTGAFAPHSLALSLCIGLTVPLALSAEQKKKSILFLILILSIAIVVSIARTYARTGYTALIGMLVVLNFLSWFYGQYKNSEYKNSLIGIFTFMIFLVSILYAVNNIEPLRTRFQDLADSEKAGSGRLNLYRSALTYFSSYNVFEKMIGRGIVASHQYMEKTFATHNDYLFILLSGGILGSCLIFWLFLEFLREIKPHSKQNYLPSVMAASSIAVYIIASATNNVMTYTSVMTYFSFLVGGAIGYYRIKNA